MKLNINAKLLLSILSVTTIIFTVIFVFISMQIKPIIESNVEKMADEHAGKYAYMVRSYLTEEMKTARTLADHFEVMTYMDGANIIKQTIAVQENIFLKNQDYKSVWMSWERQFIDSTWNKNYGRFRLLSELIGGVPGTRIDSLNWDSDDKGSLYYKLKTGKEDVLTDPYYDEFDGVTEMVASVTSRVVVDGVYAGLSGIDIPLSRFTKIIGQADRIYGSTAFLVSNDGIFVGNQEEAMVGTSIDDIFVNSSINIKDKIQIGKAFSLYYMMHERGEYYITFYPFVISGTTTPWMVGVAIPRDAITSVSNETLNITIGVGILGFVILSLVIFIVARRISSPLESITRILKNLSQGKISNIKRLKYNSKDEIGEIAKSANLLIDGLTETAMFAKEIGHGNLNVNFESVGDDDMLGNALVEMRSSLLKAQKDEEARRRQEKELSWATGGYAKFGELLRSNTDNMEDFTYSVVSDLVKYTNANQGAIFLVDSTDENDKFLTMSSCYAYDRKKFIDQRIELGENLIGQCYLEGQSIYMTDVPEDYVSITSGLGDANPRSLLIVPLKFNEQVYGVVELASFKEFDAYKIDFIEKVAESIASTISTVRVNLRTITLLEESKLKSEELAAQEEEMRQNMEELQTTQEESARRELEMNGILNALNSSFFVGEFDLDGNILAINDKALEVLGVTKSSAEGYNIRSFMNDSEIDSFNELIEKVKQGETIDRVHNIERAIGKLKIYEFYSPIYNDMDEVYKILNIGVSLG